LGTSKAANKETKALRALITQDPVSVTETPQHLKEPVPNNHQSPGVLWHGLGLTVVQLLKDIKALQTLAHLPNHQQDGLGTNPS
jgi:hypothetical protein